MHWLTRCHLDLKRQAANPQPIIEVAVLQIDPTEDLPPPAMPTKFFCGSRDKLDVMRERFEAGVGIFHDGDSIRKIVPRWDVWGKRIPWE